MGFNSAIDESLFGHSAVRSVRCDDPYAEWSRRNGAHEENVVLVELFWRRIPLQKDAVQAVVRATAAAVVQWFDDWDLTLTRPWLSEARRLMAGGLLPIPEDYEPESHLRDFRRLLPQHTFRVKVGLGAGADVADQETYALERILHWACDLLEADAVFFLQAQNESQEVRRYETDIPEPEIVAPPLRGKPHPLSESEQKLAKAIVADKLLAPLLSFNTPVNISALSQPCVDVLWEAGKLVIEIDDATHWHKVKYAADRQRDFELLASGYLVLRITAEEALTDTAKAVCKIKKCVELRRQG
jgi:very-short-patch-repair endonuclease